MNEKEINIEISRLNTLQILAETYEAAASASMRRIRSSVLQNRAFHEGLNQLYGEVKLAYRKEVLRLMRMKKMIRANTLSLIKHNGKTAFVLLMSNAGLYGDIIGRVFTFFMQELKRANADAVVVGRMGKMLFEESVPGARYMYFDFPDNAIDIESLKNITNNLSRYERVFVFYGSFKSFFIQRPTFSNISGEEMELQGFEKEKYRYAFEPSLEEVDIFFETEIFASLLEQLLQESRLAKLASRILLLQSAMQHIEQFSNEMTMRSRVLRHRTINKKQLDANIGILMRGR